MALGGLSNLFKSSTTTNYASTLSDLGLNNLGITNNSKNYLIPANIISSINKNNQQLSGQNIYFSSVGYTNPKLGFVSHNLTSNNFGIIQRTLGVNNTNDDLGIKTFNYEYTNDVRDAMLKINPSLSNYSWGFEPVQPQNITSDNNIYYENIFKPSAEILVDFNNYKFVYDNTIPVLDGYYNKDGKVVSNILSIKATPALFNPLFMVQHLGITPNTPLLNNAKTNTGQGGTIVDTSNCTIKELVKESLNPNSLLGLSRYRYIDFMYCKDLGKVANNHLITLRKFAHPIGDNIFEYYEKSPGDIGRLITWFGTDDNKLEDILNFEYRATWKELNAKIEQIQSKEDNENRGPMGMLLNSLNPGYNKMGAQGHTGHQNIFGFFGIGNNYSDDNSEILGNYDNNKVYEPKNTIQDTVMYEGKLQFTNEFTLTFCYKLRAYDNINPRSAFLDLLGNIMSVTYRRGRFWGGSRKMIGPPQNVSGWQKVNSIINNKWEQGMTAISGLLDGNTQLGDIFGMFGNSISNLLGSGKELLQNFMNHPKEYLSKGFDFLKEKGLTDMALGQIKNKLGRPALYAMDSLLKGDNVGLWHLTIGNPKNPIAVMGNLILTNSRVQISGPLGLDDFPSDIKVTCTLKHARSRDAVEIGRMFTKGTNGIYYTYQGKGRPGNNKDKGFINQDSFIVGENDDKSLKTSQQQDAEVNTNRASENINSKQLVKQFNQDNMLDIKRVLTEIA